MGYEFEEFLEKCRSFLECKFLNKLSNDYIKIFLKYYRKQKKL